MDKENPNYVFKPAYHKRIPADGVAMYMEGIWVRVPPTTFSCIKLCANDLLGTSPIEQGP